MAKISPAKTSTPDSGHINKAAAHRYELSAVRENRVSQVAEYRLKGLSGNKIAEKLAEGGLLNPETGKPFCSWTINADLALLRALWRRRARQSTDNHMARQLATLELVLVKAWEILDEVERLRLVLKTIEQMGKLTGTLRERVDLTHTVTLAVKPAPVANSEAWLEQVGKVQEIGFEDGADGK